MKRKIKRIVCGVLLSVITLSLPVSANSPVKEENVISDGFGTVIEVEKSEDEAFDFWTEVDCGSEYLQEQVVTCSNNSTVTPTTYSDVIYLAAIAQYEAGTNYKGCVAVCNCVLNRKKHKSFPNTVRGVIYQAHQFGTVSYTNVLNKFLKNPNKTCLKAARAALNGTNLIGSRLYFRSSKTVKYHKNNLKVGGNTFF